jgi:hypothetical protein
MILDMASESYEETLQKGIEKSPASLPREAERDLRECLNAAWDLLSVCCIVKPSRSKEWHEDSNPSLATAFLTIGVSLTHAIGATVLFGFPSQSCVAMRTNLNRAVENCVAVDTSVIRRLHFVPFLRRCDTVFLPHLR